MKDPCYAYDLVGPTDDPTCLHGAPWHDQVTQAAMGGDLGNTNISVKNDDNFHLVQDTDPIHLPELDSECAADVTEACTINSVTVSENKYSTLDKADTGYYPIAATEMKTKLKSRQAVETAAGMDSPDFSVTDETGNRCADINQNAIDWAYGKLNTKQ